MEIPMVVECVAFIMLFAGLFLCYRYLSSLDEYVTSIAFMLQRTFEYYYKSENIKPMGINWGIDLIWNPNSDEDDEFKKGFITIYYGEDSGIDTPIEDVVECDILSQKIIETVEKHLHDKEMGVMK